MKETATIDMVYDAEQDVLEELFQLQYVKDETEYVSRLRKSCDITVLHMNEIC